MITPKSKRTSVTRDQYFSCALCRGAGGENVSRPISARVAASTCDGTLSAFIFDRPSVMDNLNSACVQYEPVRKTYIHISYNKVQGVYPGHTK